MPQRGPSMNMANWLNPRPIQTGNIASAISRDMQNGLDSISQSKMSAARFKYQEVQTPANVLEDKSEQSSSDHSESVSASDE